MGVSGSKLSQRDTDGPEGPSYYPVTDGPEGLSYHPATDGPEGPSYHRDVGSAAVLTLKGSNIIAQGK